MIPYMGNLQGSSVDTGYPQDSEIPGRILAIDYGRRRIGVALSDPMRIIASPHGILSSRSPDELFSQICRLVRDLDVSKIVVGLPLGLQGEESPMAKEVSEWGRRLKEKTGVEVCFLDESLSTAEADRISRALGSKQVPVDDIAASLNLREYLEQLR